MTKTMPLQHAPQQAVNGAPWRMISSESSGKGLALAVVESSAWRRKGWCTDLVAKAEASHERGGRGLAGLPLRRLTLRLGALLATEKLTFHVRVF